jgi:glycosyltransferase involved in cell wall biosynthesis
LWRHRRAFDIIQAFQVGYSSSCAITAGRLLGKKTVLTLSSSGSGGDVMRHRHSPWGRVFLYLCRQVSSIVVLNDRMRDELSAWRATISITSIPNGVDLTMYSPGSDRPGVRRRLGLTPNDRLIVYAGRLSPEKGVDFLVRAFCRMQPDSSVKLWLLGEGPQRAQLERLVHECGCRQQVLLTGDVSDVAPYLQSADLFVMPSQFEGQSNAVLEAMACGLPVIVTDVAGNNELVSHGENGLLVDYGDEAALDAAMRSLLDNQLQSQALAARAHTYVRERHNLQDAVARYEALYNSLHAEPEHTA